MYTQQYTLSLCPTKCSGPLRSRTGMDPTDNEEHLHKGQERERDRRASEIVEQREERLHLCRERDRTRRAAQSKEE